MIYSRKGVCGYLITIEQNKNFVQCDGGEKYILIENPNIPHYSHDRLLVRRTTDFAGLSILS